MSDVEGGNGDGNAQVDDNARREALEEKIRREV